MTGHLVLTSVHADNTVSALSRLIELGASHRVLANVVSGVIAQRLIRLRCAACTSIAEIKHETTTCTVCRGSHYHGRVAIFECLRMSESLSAKLLCGESESRLMEHAKSDGTKTLQQSAQQLVASGKTSKEELVRVLGNER